MALLDIQRRGREIGRIRIGMQVKSGNGKTRPTKLEAFRFTTHSQMIASRVGEVFGGEVRPWTPEGGSAQWEVITSATTLPVIVPPGDAVISQFYELWSGGGCTRRCDGIKEQLGGTPCKCPPAGPERAAAAAEGNACKPTTRLNVMLPDLPDIGVWRLESHGFYAATELGGAAELLRQAREAGVMLPATLRLEQRSVKRPGQTVKRFAVPVLEIGVSLRELTSGDMPKGRMPELPAPPRAALTAGEETPPKAKAGPALPADSETLAEEAKAATDADTLRAIWRRGAAAGVLEEHVDTGEGVFDQLSVLLMARMESLLEAAQ